MLCNAVNTRILQWIYFSQNGCTFSAAQTLCINFVAWLYGHLYKDEVSSLVHILKLVTFYHEVLESQTSHSLLEVSEELPESVSLGSNYVYTIGINEPLLEPSLTLPEEIADSKSNPSWLLCYLTDIFHPSNSHSTFSWPKTTLFAMEAKRIVHIVTSSIGPAQNRMYCKTHQKF